MEHGNKVRIVIILLYDVWFSVYEILMKRKSVIAEKALTQPLISAGKKVALNVPVPWPNGSGIYTVPSEDSPRTELGRIFRVDSVFRILSVSPAGYSDEGTAASFYEALSMLPEVQISSVAVPVPARRRGRPPGSGKKII